jgi:hypothetical protein
MCDRCIDDPPLDVHAGEKSDTFCGGGIGNSLHIARTHGGYGLNRPGIAPRDFGRQRLCLAGGNQVLATAMP